MYHIIHLQHYTFASTTQQKKTKLFNTEIFNQTKTLKF